MVLERLCADVYYEIFSYLNQYDIYSLTFVNKELYTLIDERFKSFRFIVYSYKLHRKLYKYYFIFNGDKKIVFNITKLDRFADEMIIVMKKNGVKSIIMYKNRVDESYSHYVKLLMSLLNKKYMINHTKFTYVKKCKKDKIKLTNKLI